MSNNPIISLYRRSRPKFFLILFSILLLLSGCFSSLIYLALANGDGSDPCEKSPRIESKSEGWIYAFCEYRHDWLDPRTAFLKIMGTHPKSKVPLITGGYAQTDVFAFVRIRGIDTHQAMHHETVRHRPHRWIEREREDWDRAMQYVWRITSPTRTFRLSNLKVIACDDYLKRLTGESKILEGDFEFFLGGAWHSLSTAMLQDEHARPLQEDVNWDGGTRKYSFENPNNPN